MASRSLQDLIDNVVYLIHNRRILFMRHACQTPIMWWKLPRRPEISTMCIPPLYPLRQHFRVQPINCIVPWRGFISGIVSKWSRIRICGYTTGSEVMFHCSTSVDCARSSNSSVSVGKCLDAVSIEDRDRVRVVCSGCWTHRWQLRQNRCLLSYRG
jgi:hypothetical protein